jgi:2'-5' RNA ligase
MLGRDGVGVRHQLTAFVPEESSERIDGVRRTWDPVMARRIRPHITLAHEVDDVDDTLERVRAFASDSGPLRVHLAQTDCWGSPAGGIFVVVEDRCGDVARLHDHVVGSSSIAYVAHVTLLHPRTTQAAARASAWTVLQGLTFDQDLDQRTVSLVASGADGVWTEVATVTLGGGS